MVLKRKTTPDAHLHLYGFSSRLRKFSKDLRHDVEVGIAIAYEQYSGCVRTLCGQGRDEKQRHQLQVGQSQTQSEA
jgi:hypothetical protein